LVKPIIVVDSEQAEEREEFCYMGSVLPLNDGGRDREFNALGDSKCSSCKAK